MPLYSSLGNNSETPSRKQGKMNENLCDSAAVELIELTMRCGVPDLDAGHSQKNQVGKGDHYIIPALGRAWKGFSSPTSLLRCVQNIPMHCPRGALSSGGFGKCLVKRAVWLSLRQGLRTRSQAKAHNEIPGENPGGCLPLTT